MTDLGFTGGGKGAGMVYVGGRPDHKVDNDAMIAHIVALVEAKAQQMKGQAPDPPRKLASTSTDLA